MEKTIELISGRVTEIESVIKESFAMANDNFTSHRKAIECLCKRVSKQRTFNKLVIIAGIYGAYTLHKQNKELQELKAKNEGDANYDIHVKCPEGREVQEALKDVVGKCSEK